MHLQTLDPMRLQRTPRLPAQGRRHTGLRPCRQDQRSSPDRSRRTHTGSRRPRTARDPSRPPPNPSIIIPRPEPHKPSIPIIHPPSKPKRRQSRRRVPRHIPKLIVVNLLNNGPRSHIDDQPRTAKVVAKDAERPGGVREVVRHVGLGTKDEASHDVARAVELRHDVQGILIEEARRERRVDLLPNPPILPVDDVVNRGPVGSPT